MQYQEGIIGHRNRSTSVGPCADNAPTTCAAEVAVMADSLAPLIVARRIPRSATGR
jgi:hypothetical protein